ncbi:VRR-NUC domain-containing protein [uncultured Agitococcus sp.]|uniref:VRR-NUC domain-containing protein n=1 Tax=uncultured Agitococcus sp. TaxID=1506599 RepID=UPI00260757AB|nr:VRR-NUC domain-containing protein [uncultured Agitococcus sp.]
MRAAKVDKNQAEIVDAFRKMGFSVQHLHTVGSGVPDLLIGRGGVNLLVEVKDGGKAKLTPEQIKWHDEWRGQVAIVRNIDDVVKLVSELV